MLCTPIFVRGQNKTQCRVNGQLEISLEVNSHAPISLWSSRPGQTKILAKVSAIIGSMPRSMQSGTKKFLVKILTADYKIGVHSIHGHPLDSKSLTNPALPYFVFRISTAFIQVWQKRHLDYTRIHTMHAIHHEVILIIWCRMDELVNSLCKQAVKKTIM